MSAGRFKIVIVGGGSAGWMTAATLAKACPDKDITLIESPNIPIVGVGESTLGQINNWLGYMGIEDKEFMKATDATYKLSIRFQDFYRKGGGHFHYPFGEPDTRGTQNDTNDWIDYRIMEGNTEPVHTYAEWYYTNMLLVNSGKLCENPLEKLPMFNFKQDVAYHFDAVKFGQYLKSNWALNKGVKYIVGDVTDTMTDENGIRELMINKHQTISADLFIDCTGFKSLLLDKALKEPFESYEDILPNNSAVAARVPFINQKKQTVPYTNCIAYDNGWIWEIPLWTRMGMGYVYSDKYISDEQAKIDFKEYLKKGNHPIDNVEFRTIKMRVGVHKRIYSKNVCAIGLAAGFIEPLESNGLFTVHEFLMQLVRILQRHSPSRFDKDAFNWKCKLMFRNFAEFVAMHYAMTQRDDTKYWRDVKNREYCTDLIDLKPSGVNGFRDTVWKRFERYWYDPSYQGIDCIAHGMHWFPTDEMSLKHALACKDTTFRNDGIKLGKKNTFNIIKTKEKIIKDWPKYFDFLRTYIYDGGNVAKIKIGKKK